MSGLSSSASAGTHSTPFATSRQAPKNGGGALEKALPTEMEEAMLSGEGTPPGAWSLKGISWLFLLLNFPWGTIISTALFAVLPGTVVHYHLKEFKWPYRVYDVAISYPVVPEVLAYWWGFFVPAIFFAFSVLVIEGWFFRKTHKCLTNVISAVLLLFVECTAAATYMYSLTEVSKKLVGQLRPYFLATCRPQPYLFPDRLHIIEDIEHLCDNDRAYHEAGRSFPSGHASISATVALYAVVYCLWSLLFRQRRSVFLTAHTWPQVILRDFLHGASLFWGLLIQAGSWVLGILRIQSFHHSPSDVVAGHFLGALGGIAWGLHTIICFRFLPVYDPATRKAVFTDGREVNL